MGAAAAAQHYDVGSLSPSSPADLGHNALTEVPPVVFRMQRLASLNLEHNRIGALYPSSRWKVLRVLSLADNELVAPSP